MPSVIPKASVPSTSQPPGHFDKQRIRRAFDRAAAHYDDSAVLQQEICKRLLEKLDIIRLQPGIVLDAGSGTGYAIPHLFSRYPRSRVVAMDISENMLAQAMKYSTKRRTVLTACADIEAMPFADESFDFVFSNLSLQWCNDLPAALTEVYRVLKPGGLFLFTTFGPDTLKELRACWAAVDDNEHINRFVDMHDIGDMLMQLRYAEPVMEAELLTLTYTSVPEVLHDLRGIGANVKSDQAINRQRAGLGGKQVFRQLTDRYETYRNNGRLPASYEVIYGHAWKAAPDTQKSSSSDTAKQQTVFFNQKISK
jgi:malonyl-CoA O-methyltransferase